MAEKFSLQGREAAGHVNYRSLSVGTFHLGSILGCHCTEGPTNPQ